MGALHPRQRAIVTRGLLPSPVANGQLGNYTGVTADHPRNHIRSAKGVAMQRRTRRIGRRRLLLTGATAGVGALAAAVPGAQAQRAQGPGGIEWLDYDPPRQFAAGARVGNVVYLSGVTG